MQAPAPTAAGMHTPETPQSFLEPEEVDKFTALFKSLIKAGSNVSKKDPNYKLILRESVASTASAQELRSRHSAFMKEYCTTQRIFFEKIYEMVRFLRTKKEPIDWECDTQRTLQASSHLLSQWMRLDQKTGIELNARLTDQLSDYVDPSSPAQLNDALYFRTLWQASPSSDKSSFLLATKYTEAYEHLQSFLAAWSTSDPLEKGYGELVGRIKALGGASKRFKEVTLESLTRDLIDNVYTTGSLEAELAKEQTRSACPLQ